jgi:hypothetical protein
MSGQTASLRVRDHDFDGVSVGDRGRIPANVIEQCQAAT